MDEEIKPKTVGLAETIFLVLLVGIEELIEVAILLVTLGTGIVVVEIMNVATAALMEMYMLLRGGTGVKRLLIQPLGAFFDGLLGTILPIKTFSMVIGIWMINNSEKIEKVVGPAGQIIASGGRGAVTATTARSAAVAASAQTAVGATSAETAIKATPSGSGAAIRARMATSSGVRPPSNVIGAERMAQARAQRQQGMQQNNSENMPLQEAA